VLLVEAVDILTMLSVKEASAKLPELIDDVTVSHEPLVITGKHRNAVLVAEDQWKAITEKLHLFSSPGMRKSILGGVPNEKTGSVAGLLEKPEAEEAPSNLASIGR
tara:strand:- start:1194 stop:1511 length:318 start_codon:yes stop_codon:yes gene_type:complete